MTNHIDRRDLPVSVDNENFMNYNNPVDATVREADERDNVVDYSTRSHQLSHVCPSSPNVPKPEVPQKSLPPTPPSSNSPSPNKTSQNSPPGSSGQVPCSSSCHGQSQISAQMVGQQEIRRYRTAFTKEQVNRLEKEFTTESYVTRPKRCELAKELNLGEGTIKVWFQNRRMKEKRNRMTFPYYVPDQLSALLLQPAYYSMLNPPGIARAPRHPPPRVHPYGFLPQLSSYAPSHYAHLPVCPARDPTKSDQCACSYIFSRSYLDQALPQISIPKSPLNFFPAHPPTSPVPPPSPPRPSLFQPYKDSVRL